jgi:hypothetical protein
MLSEPLQILLKVTAVFDRLRIPYLIGGSLASALYGVARATLDADLVADIHVDQISELAASLEPEFYVDAEMIRNSLDDYTCFNLIHLETMFKVDVFPLKQRSFDLNQMARRIPLLIGDEPKVRMFFSTAEDIILAKMEWYRAGGETSDRQWQDILGVLKLQNDRLDFQYLQKWADRLGLLDLYQRAVPE